MYLFNVHKCLQKWCELTCIMLLFLNLAYDVLCKDEPYVCIDMCVWWQLYNKPFFLKKIKIKYCIVFQQIRTITLWFLSCVVTISFIVAFLNIVSWSSINRWRTMRSLHSSCTALCSWHRVSKTLLLFSAMYFWHLFYIVCHISFSDCLCTYPTQKMNNCFTFIPWTVYP